MVKVLLMTLFGSALLLCGIVFFIRKLNDYNQQKKQQEFEDSREQREKNYFEGKYKDLLRNGDFSNEQPYIWAPYTSFDDSEMGRGKAQKAMTQRVLDMPQLDFDQWMTFYTNNPEVWIIEKRENKTFANIPYYVKTYFHKDGKDKEYKNTVYIPTFWKSAEEMLKYRKWVEEEYQKGNAAIFEKNRAENLSKLTKYLREDIQEQRGIARKEFEEYQKRIDKEQEEFEKLNKTGVMTLTFGNQAVQIQKEKE